MGGFEDTLLQIHELQHDIMEKLGVHVCLCVCACVCVCARMCVCVSAWVRACVYV